MQAARRSGPIGSYLGHALAAPEPRSAETAAPRHGAAYPASVVTLAQLSVAHPPALGAGRCLPRTRRGLSPAQCGPPTRPSGWVLASPHPLVAPARYREVLRARLRH